MEKDFNQALIEANNALKSYPARFRRKAIFQKAMLYGYPDSGFENLKKSIFYFTIVEKENEDAVIQSHARFIKDILVYAENTETDNKRLSEELSALNKKYSALLAQQSKWLEKKQTLEKKNAALSARINQLENETITLQSKDYEKEDIKEEVLTE